MGALKVWNGTAYEELVIAGNTSAASNVTFAPTGTVEATTVQAAIAEVSGDVTAHVADTDDAHDASAVSVLDAGGYYTGTNVETVLAELPGKFSPVAQVVKVGWYFVPAGTRSTATMSVDRGHFIQLVVPACKLDLILCETTVGGGAGSVTRLGIYSSLADGMPGALVLDAGTVSTTGIGVQQISISQSLAAGEYWLCLSPQVGTTPTYRIATGAAQLSGGVANGTANAFGSGGNSGLYTFGGWATGALPATAGTLSNNIAAPVISVRFATP